MPSTSNAATRRWNPLSLNSPIDCTSFDPGQGHVHSAISRGTTPTVFVATFYAAPAEGSLLIPAEPGNC
jgi:hypothetical protein